LQTKEGKPFAIPAGSLYKNANFDMPEGYLNEDELLFGESNQILADEVIYTEDYETENIFTCL